MKLSKENGSQQDMDELFRKSGIHNFLTAMVDATGSKEVTAAKVSSCRTQIDELIKELGQTTEREQNHWKAKLQEIGWDEKRNVDLNNIKREADAWIKNEAESVGRKINAHIEDDVVSYICDAGEKLTTYELQEKIVGVWKDEINSRRKAWSNELCKIYEERMKHLEFDDDHTFDIPDWLNGETIANMVKNETVNIMEAIRKGGVQSALQMSGGALLLAIAPGLMKIPFVGTALAGTLGVIGPIFIGLGAFTIVPAYMRIRSETKDRLRKDITNKVENWLDKMDTTSIVERLLMIVNDETFNKLSAEDDKKADEFKRNYNACGDIAYNLNEIHCNIIQQFSVA